MCLLLVTVAALGGAAKRRQYPANRHQTGYLSKAAKMSEARIHQAHSGRVIPKLSPYYASSVGTPVVHRDLFDQGSRFLITFDRILRIELQSPPLLV